MCDYLCKHLCMKQVVWAIVSHASMCVYALGGFHDNTWLYIYIYIYEQLLCPSGSIATLEMHDNDSHDGLWPLLNAYDEKYYLGENMTMLSLKKLHVWFLRSSRIKINNQLKLIFDISLRSTLLKGFQECLFPYITCIICRRIVLLLNKVNSLTKIRIVLSFLFYYFQ